MRKKLEKLWNAIGINIITAKPIANIVSSHSIYKNYIQVINYESSSELTEKYLKEGNMNTIPLPVKEEEGIDTQIIKYLEEGDSGRRTPQKLPFFQNGQKVKISDDLNG